MLFGLYVIFSDSIFCFFLVDFLVLLVLLFLFFHVFPSVVVEKSKKTISSPIVGLKLALTLKGVAKKKKNKW